MFITMSFGSWTLGEIEAAAANGNGHAQTYLEDLYER
jgi:hypothetical protein